jgi:hypothetical protein
MNTWGNMDDDLLFQELKESVIRHKKKIWKRMVRKNLVITSVTWDAIWREMKKSRGEVNPELVHRLQSWYLLYKEFPSHKTEEQVLLSPNCDMKQETYFSPLSFDLEDIVLPGDLWYREDPIVTPDQTSNEQLPSIPMSERACKWEFTVDQKKEELLEVCPNPNLQGETMKRQNPAPEKRKGLPLPTATPVWTRVPPAGDGVYPEDCEKDGPVTFGDKHNSQQASKDAQRGVQESKNKGNENTRSMKIRKPKENSSRSEVKKVHWSPPFESRPHELKPRNPNFKRDSQTQAQHYVSQQSEQIGDIHPKPNARGKPFYRRIVPMASSKYRQSQSWSSNGKSRSQNQIPQSKPRTKLKYHKKREKWQLQQESKGQRVAHTETSTIKKRSDFPPRGYVYHKGDWTVHAIVSSSAEITDVKDALERRDYKVKFIVRRKCKLPKKWICSLIASADRTHILTSENIWLKGWEVDFVCNEEEIAQFLE